MRLGVFGGSFDPVHYGHLLLAECCREQARLDAVWFVPAAAPPHKLGRELGGARQRVEMLKLALAGYEGFEVSTLEIDRGGVSYTVDTLLALRERHPDAELYLLMGGDSLRDLPAWKETRRVLELAVPLVARRGEAPEPAWDALRGIVADERLAAIRAAQVTAPVIELSSTDLRRRAAEGRSLRFRTPRAVEKYIETQGLYRPATGPAE